MVARIEIIYKVTDSRATVLKKRLQNLDITGTIDSLEIIDVYLIDKKLSKNQFKQIASMISNPVSQSFKVFCSNQKEVSQQLNYKNYFNWHIEYGYLPGVTDNVGSTAKESIEDLLKIKFEKDEGVYTAQLVLLAGNLKQQSIKIICESLVNPLIQRINYHNIRLGEHKLNENRFYMPKVYLETEEKSLDILEVDLNISDGELTKIGKLGIINQDGDRNGPLSLRLEYLQIIKEYFNKINRNPTDIELESLAQTWSEHCKHTIFANPIDELRSGLYQSYIQKATKVIRRQKGKSDFCVSVFTDNSGAIEFNKDYLVTHKVETHNSPSALDPFGGAITGIVGVNRDAIGFGMGAKPIVNTYGFMLADPRKNKSLYKDKSLTLKMLSSRRIMDGVVSGVNAGGNTSGIPTPQGFVYFDEKYRGKPLVFVGTIGLIPKQVAGKPSWVKKAIPGDLIVMIGGRVGLDGIHGATFSSAGLDGGSPATAVQIGDPITQKKLSDAIVKEARDMGLYTSITDNGAGGLSCSVAEMAKESGGAEVDLEKVPTKYSGLKPWQIWISESQERMTLSVPKKKWKKLYSLMQRRGVEATVIGRFTGSGKCIVLYKNKKIMNIDMEFLHNGLPRIQLTTKKRVLKKIDINLGSRSNFTQDLLGMLQRPSIASFEYISSQYDYEVQSSSVIKPLQGSGRVNGNTTIIKPIITSIQGIVLSQGYYPRYSDIDSYKMATASIDTAIRNIITAGANPEKIAILDNFCWCSSNDPKRLWQLKEACRACYETSVQFSTPFISGKDSMFNDFSGYNEQGKSVKISVLPTLLISSIGIIDDVKNAVSMDPKSTDELVYMLGETKEEMGGSEYFNFLNRRNNNLGDVPVVNVQKNKILYKTYYQSVCAGLISSAVSIGIGGIAIAVCKMSLSSLKGIEVNLNTISGDMSRDDFVLYSESQGRIIVTVSARNEKSFEKKFQGIGFTKVGKVRDDQYLVINGVRSNEIIKTSLEKIMTAYKGTFKNY